MLTGTELLTKVKELGEASKTELVRATGYVSTKEDGSERLNYTAFYEALLEARGIHLGPARGDGTPGRKLSYTTHVLFNGNLLIGKAYTAQLVLKPGDPFQIQLGRRQIKLLQLDAPQEGEEDSGADAAGQLEQAAAGAEAAAAA
ncbi:MAG: AbrB family transcriptional regulator [Cyanobium sp.]